MKTRGCQVRPKFTLDAFSAQVTLDNPWTYGYSAPRRSFRCGFCQAFSSRRAPCLEITRLDDTSGTDWGEI